MTQHPNFKRMFGEAVRDSVRDHADQNPEILKAACGYHLVRLVRGGPLVPAELWESNTEPDCPENVLDRSRPYFVAKIAGEDVDPLDVICAFERRPITEAEFKFRVADCTWTKAHSPEEPQANPKKRINLLTAPLPF